MARNLIYGYLDPRTGFLRYVGKSSRGLKRPQLYNGHRGHCGCWIKSLRALNLKPEILVLEELPDTACNADFTEAEQRHIAYWRFLGCDLTNLTAGGEGMVGYKHPPEVQAKITASLYGNTRTRGKKASAETRARMSAAHKNRVRDPAIGQKISAAKKGKKFSAAHRAALSAAKIGKTHSAAWFASRYRDH